MFYLIALVAHAATAASGSPPNLLVYYIGGPLFVAFAIWVARSTMKFFEGRQKKQHQQDYDQRTLSEFFFDTPRDPNTGTPAKQGWTTKVDATLETLTRGQAHTTKLIHEVLGELKPDNNGGHNFRGLMERSAEAAGIEVSQQTEERNRVQGRDKRLDESNE